MNAEASQTTLLPGWAKNKTEKNKQSKAVSYARTCMQKSGWVGCHVQFYITVPSPCVHVFGPAYVHILQEAAICCGSLSTRSFQGPCYPFEEKRRGEKRKREKKKGGNVGSLAVTLFLK
jgi:hypothetical protein